MANGKPSQSHSHRHRSSKHSASSASSSSSREKQYANANGVTHIKFHGHHSLNGVSYVPSHTHSQPPSSSSSSPPPSSSISSRASHKQQQQLQQQPHLVYKSHKSKSSHSNKIRALPGKHHANHNDVASSHTQTRSYQPQSNGTYYAAKSPIDVDVDADDIDSAMTLVHSNSVQPANHHQHGKQTVSDSEIVDLTASASASANHHRHSHENSKHVMDTDHDHNNNNSPQTTKRRTVDENNDTIIIDKMNGSPHISLSPLQIHPKEEEKQQSNGYSDKAKKSLLKRGDDDEQGIDTDDEEEDEEFEDEEDEAESVDGSGSCSSSSDSEFEHAFPVKAIAFDLDKTMVRTISLPHDEQPQPEQHPGGYFMFFDDDTKEYHHVYKRPHLRELLDFLNHAIVSQNKCKMMLCTHGTQKYAQTILERCDADKLFPLMLPRRDWMRRKFDDDYKPRRFKTIKKMAQSVGMPVEDLIMIDDDPGVYSKGDRCNGSLVHIKPFDDPYEQRDDTELTKLIKLLSAIMKYGKNYYNKLFANAIRYTGLVKTYMSQQQMAQHSLFRAELLKILMYDFSISMNRQERLGTLFLFDRYCSTHPINWSLIGKQHNKPQQQNQTMAYFVILLFVCLFIARQYLYTDSKRPKQFRRDPYSAEIWLIHVELYERIVKKYKLRNQGSGDNAEPQHTQSKHKNHRSSHHHHHHKSSKHSKYDENEKKQQAASNSAHNVVQENMTVLTAYNGGGDGANAMYQQQMQQNQCMAHSSYHSQSHHRRKRKHKNREKHIYFTELHNIQNQVMDGIGYPKLLHGLYHRPENGFDSSLFVRYEDYVESLVRHIEKQQMQKLANDPFRNMIENK
eukprot:CAMPEP_0197043736 /NCGR_PEP_ID=MMETSP1384-20130603/19937_1 /TAXON_ID=29189 /ORGANISM="Ammonia sp." /LENGTH=846 /DNA_ID=CAMNT_0042475083 /DNA_START=551 /DNA_END=3091 /DNA_ORIENTATION=+